jgi:hypothetical protein
MQAAVLLLVLASDVPAPGEAGVVSPARAEVVRTYAFAKMSEKEARLLEGARVRFRIFPKKAFTVLGNPKRNEFDLLVIQGNDPVKRTAFLMNSRELADEIAVEATLCIVRYRSARMWDASLREPFTEIWLQDVVPLPD